MMTVAIPAQTPANVLPFVPVPSPIKSQPAPIVAHALSAHQLDSIRAICEQGRDATIAAIKAALKRRSRKSWSVTGGRGTAWGWITIDAPPARRTWTHKPKPGLGDCPPPGNEFWDYVNTFETGHGTSPQDCEELAKLMGLPNVHEQGHNVPACNDHYRVALCRAMHGHAGPFSAEQYWD